MFFFTGDDRFLLQLELQRRKQGFKAKFGADALVSYDGQHRDETQIRQDLLGTDLFSPKKMLIISGIPEDTTKDNALKASQVAFFDTLLEQEAKHINPDHIIIFVSYTPDKRKKLYKRAEKHTDIKQFTQKKTSDLINLVGEWLTTSSSFTPDDIKKIATHLVDHVGTDTGRLWQESQKIMSWEAGRELEMQT